MAAPRYAIRKNLIILGNVVLRKLGSLPSARHRSRQVEKHYGGQKSRRFEELAEPSEEELVFDRFADLRIVGQCLPEFTEVAGRQRNPANVDCGYGHVRDGFADFYDPGWSISTSALGSTSGGWLELVGATEPGLSAFEVDVRFGWRWLDRSRGGSLHLGLSCGLDPKSGRR